MSRKKSRRSPRWLSRKSALRRAQDARRFRQLTFERCEERTLLAIVTLTANDATATEAGQTTGQYTITRDDVTSSALVVNVTVSGTATNGTDYSTINGSYAIPANEASVTVTVTPTNDPNNEGNETAILTLASGDYTNGTPSTGTVSITDNDPAISVGDLSQGEADTGSVNANFTLTLAYATDYDIAVSYATANGTATAGADYTSSSGSLTFSAGQVTKTAAVPLLADTAQEVAETLYLNLTPPTGITGDTQALGTITDSSTFGPETRGQENPTGRWADTPQTEAGEGEEIDRFAGSYRMDLPLADDDFARARAAM